MEALKADYTEVWVPSAIKPLVQFADQVRAIADTGLDLVGIAETSVFDALREFDEIVSWYGTNREEFRDAVADLPFQFFPALPPPPGEPKIVVPEVPRTRIIVHPFSASSKKNWPLAKFEDLAERLGAEFAVHRDGSPIIEDLYALGCWLAHAKVFIGNDSGITHLAAAVGTPVVALFGPMDPAIWAPRTKQSVVIRRQPMDEITVDEVVAAVEHLLARECPDGTRQGQ